MEFVVYARIEYDILEISLCEGILSIGEVQTSLDSFCDFVIFGRETLFCKKVN